MEQIYPYVMQVLPCRYLCTMIRAQRDVQQFIGPEPGLVGTGHHLYIIPLKSQKKLFFSLLI